MRKFLIKTGLRFFYGGLIIVVATGVVAAKGLLHFCRRSKHKLLSTG